MKKIFLLFFALIALAAADAQNANDCFQRFINEGDQALKSRQFDRARRKYLAAIECPELNAQQRASANFKLEDAERKRRQELVVAKEKAETGQKVANLERGKAVFSEKEAQKQKQIAEVAARRSLGNELGFKALVTLRDNDRTAALRLAEFAQKFADPGNARATEAVLAAAYHNNDPRNPAKLPWRIQTLLESSPNPVQHFKFSPDGKRLGIITEKMTATVWEIETGRVLFDWNKSAELYFGATFSDDLRLLAFIGTFGNYEVVDVQKGESRYDYMADNAPAGIEKLEFSNDGKRLAITNALHEIKIVDAFSGKQIFVLPADSLRYGVRFSPDFQKVADYSFASPPKIHDLGTGKTIALPTGDKFVFDLVFSNDGQRIAVSMEGKEIAVFDAGTGRERSRFNSKTLENQSVKSNLARDYAPASPAAGPSIGSAFKLKFSENGSRLAAFFASNTALILDSSSDSLNLLHNVSRNWGLLDYMDASPGLDLLFFVGYDRVEILSPERHDVGRPEFKNRRSNVEQRIKNSGYGEKLLEKTPLKATLAADLTIGFGNSIYVPAMCFSQNGLKFAWAVSEGGVKIQDFTKNKALTINALNAEDVLRMEFSPDSKQLAVSRKNGAVEIWDAEGQTVGFSVSPEMDGSEIDLVFSPDSSKIALLCEDGWLKMVDANSGALLFKQKPLKLRQSHSIEFSSDSKKLLYVSSDYTLAYPDSAVVLDTERGDEVFRFGAPQIRFSEFAGGGRYLRFLTNKFLLFEVATGLQPKFLPPGGCDFICVSPAGDLVSYKNADGLFIVETDKEAENYFKLLENESATPQKNAQRSVSKMVQQDNIGQQNNANNLLQPLDFEPATLEFPYPIRFSPDGKKLLVQTTYEKVEIYETLVWRKIGTLSYSQYYPLEFTADSRRIISENYHYQSVWDASNGRFVGGLYSGSRIPTLSPNGELIALSLENQVIIYDSELLQEQMTLRGHRLPVAGAAFSKDGKMLATISQDRTVKCWNMESGREIFTFSGDTLMAEKVMFSPDSRLLSVWFENGVKTWLIDPASLLKRIEKAGKIAPLTEAQIYEFNLEQVFANQDAEKAFEAMEPTEKLAFARYFARQGGIAQKPDVYQSAYRKAEKLYQEAINSLDSDAALLEMGKMLTKQAIKLRQDTLFDESQKSAHRAAKLFKKSKSDAAETIFNSGLANALAGDAEASEKAILEGYGRFASGFSDIFQQLEVLAQTGPDSNDWRDFINRVRGNLPAQASSFSLGELPFGTPPDRLLEEGEFKLALDGAIAALVSTTFSEQQDPDLVSANIVAQQLGNLSWYSLFTKNGLQNSERYALAGISLDSTETFIKINLAHAHLLKGDFLKAISIYQEWQNEWWDAGDMLFETSILQDLETFAKAGKDVWNKNVLRAAQVLLGENWNPADVSRFSPPEK